MTTAIPYRELGAPISPPAPPISPISPTILPDESIYSPRDLMIARNTVCRGCTSYRPRKCECIGDCAAVEPAAQIRSQLRAATCPRNLWPV